MVTTNILTRLEVMNKIIIDKNILNNYSDKDITIKDNTIYFLKNGEYNIEYLNCDNLNIEYNIMDNITVKLSVYATDNYLTNNDKYILNTNSNLSVFKFYNNNDVKENITINLNGTHSKINYSFSSICQKNEEYNIKIKHNNSYVESYISNKCLSLEKSKINFNIDSILPKGNIGCIMDQNTKIIEMGNTDTKINPNMYIEEADVEARHGSVIGRFNDDDIFYLTSRGIPESEAIKLLIKGFILSNLQPDINTRNKILENLNKNWR